MASSQNRGNSLSLAFRGSQGVWLTDGSLVAERQLVRIPESTLGTAKTMVFSKDGTLFAFCDGQSVQVLSVATSQRLCSIDKPRTATLYISSCNRILVTWEPAQGGDNDVPNLNLWDIATGSCVKSFKQKKQHEWCPQWSIDEAICGRLVNGEVVFYADNNFDAIATRVQPQGVSDFCLATNGSAPFSLAVYVSGTKGQPSYVRLYRYPNIAGLQAAVASKSFYKADKVQLLWNNAGSAILILTSTESSADSYYGEQGLHYVDMKGYSCIVPRAKEGPVFDAVWSPLSTCFCVVYGTVPAKSTLYNLKCEPIFDFGTGPRNAAYFNPHGNILCLAGYGNLQGGIDLWDLDVQKPISRCKIPDTTYVEWAPDGMHIITATLSPRLRIGNGYKVWSYTGQLISQEVLPGDQELWGVMWQPASVGVFPQPKLKYRPMDIVQEAAAEKSKAYVPPHLRDKQDAAATTKKYREEYELPSNMKQSAAGGGGGHKGKPAQQVGKKPPQDSGDDSADRDKKAKNIRKKLEQIDKLKADQAAGKHLELNQLEKIKSEAELIKQLEDLEL